MVGLSNTLSLVAAGIVFTTMLGIAAGVASFSTNWLLYKLSRVYVGLVRNVPLLLQLFFLVLRHLRHPAPARKSD
jgi:general L-amino acid transport system permease protein